MANINPVDMAYFDSFAAELMSKFQRLRHLLNDNTASGSYHEEILRAVLRNFLSKRYSVKTGYIYKDDENVSRQLDIIVVDESAPAAYIFQEGDFAIVIPECVVACIEVKTTMDTSEYDGALANIASAKSLFEFPINHPGIVFSYRAIARMNDTRADAWMKRDSAKALGNSETRAHSPDAIVFLNDNYSLLRYNAETKTIGDSYDYYSFQNPEQEIGWQVSVLLAMIVGACERGEFNRTRLFESNQASRLLGLRIMEVSDYSFKLGEGSVR